MYSNLGTKKTKNRVDENTDVKKIVNINKFIPETKIIANQTEIINKVWPKSGWDKSKTIMGTKTTKLKRYLK